jgi:ribosomal protein S18 acetylase RimI-like enzyme
VAVELGPADPPQFPAILSFWREATEVPSSTDDLDGLTALWRRDPRALIVATEDGRPVGTVIAAWDGWRGGLYRLAVLPSHRGRGIARALVAEGEAHLGRHGCRRISLFAVAAHTGAVAFWNAVGYRPDDGEIRFTTNLGRPGDT